MRLSSILFVAATVTAAPVALPAPEPQFGFGNLAGQLAGTIGNFGNIAGQVAGNFGNLIGNLSNIGSDLLGNLPSLGDFCVVPILCDFIKVVEIQEKGTTEEKEAAVKVFLADWEKATPEEKQLFAPVGTVGA